ncbi:hypothetical protein BH11ACT2_BH11ACT2_17030 [soil metagenome]
MDIPKYLLVMWSYKWLLLVGLVLAIVAGLLAAFTLVDGRIESRAAHSYTAGATVLVSSPTQPLYQAEVPGQTIKQGETAATPRDLTSSAVIYAYLISGTATQEAVEAKIGKLADDETITAVQRTTQPSGSEAFPGRLTLPILEVVGASSSPARAELIARTANEVFQQAVVQQQDAEKLAASDRVILTTIDSPVAVEDQGSNPAIPVLVTAIGVFLAFIALTFVLYNVRLNRAKRTAKKGQPAAHSDEFDALDAADTEHDEFSTAELVGAGQHN